MDSKTPPNTTLELPDGRRLQGSSINMIITPAKRSLGHKLAGDAVTESTGGSALDEQRTDLVLIDAFLQMLNIHIEERTSQAHLAATILRLKAMQGGLQLLEATHSAEALASAEEIAALIHGLEALCLKLYALEERYAAEQPTSGPTP
jgi:hypothetical protein